MKRNSPKPKDITNADIQNSINRIQHMQSTIRHLTSQVGLGKSFDGDRELYEVLGWPLDIAYTDYINIYSRDGIPKRVNDAPCNA